MNSTPGTGCIAVLQQGFDDALNVHDGNFTVWFLAGDFIRRQELSRLLPENAVLGDLGARLDTAADAVEKDLLNLDQQVLEEERDRLTWSASLIGDRSPYAGDLQINTARYLVVDEIVKAGGRHVFFVEDEQVAWALAQTAKANGLAVTCSAEMTKPPSPLMVLRARAGALKRHLRQSWTLKKRRLKRPVPWGKLAECDVLLVDWARKTTFNTSGNTLHTTNLARMADVLRTVGLNVGFVANPLSWIESYEDIADNATQAQSPVVLTDECQSVWDIIHGAWATWRLGQRLKKAAFRAHGFDLSPLFHLECIRDQIRPQSTMAFSLFSVAKALARQGVRPKAIVYPFENQGWERALIAGVRRDLPATRLIAYQHAPFAARYIGFFPSASDISMGRLPDQLVVMGPRFEMLLTQFGWPRGRLTLGGSLRFEASLANPPMSTKRTGKTVLVATSIAFDETLDLVIKAGAAVKGIVDAEMVVNFHPVVDQTFRDGVRDAVLQAVGAEMMERIEFSTASAADLIQRADVLLYNTSGAVFDACFAGVPTVHVAVDGQLSYDKVPGSATHRAIGIGDLRGFLMDIFRASDDIRQDMSIGGVIAPVDETAIVRAVRGV